MERLKLMDWGVIPYEESLEKQQLLFECNIKKKISGKETENNLILCEHPHIFTIGKHGLLSNLLISSELLKERNVPVLRTDRGGDITYHGPGQLVVYPIIDLEYFNLGIKKYIYNLEEIIIRLLNIYGINGERLTGATGVWLDTTDPEKTRKICAIGVYCSRYITKHGLALNVSPDLNFFKIINPCGFTDKQTTSMEKELNMKVNEKQLKKQLVDIFCEVF